MSYQMTPPANVADEGRNIGGRGGGEGRRKGGRRKGAAWSKVAKDEGPNL